MPSIDSYNAATTTVSFSWPPEVTGLERIMLSAQGDLQRTLSAFFARPITVALVFSQTTIQSSGGKLSMPIHHPDSCAIQKTSPTEPLIQKRQVNLLCSGRVVCNATSTVRITSPECARLFLVEKFAIGQVFRELRRVPDFELVDVGTGRSPLGHQSEIKGQQPLWRRYKVDTVGFECDILEVFPTREMFTRGEAWLDGKWKGGNCLDPDISFQWFAFPQSRKSFVALAFVLGIASIFACAGSLIILHL